MKIVAQTPIKHDGKDYAEGDLLDVSKPAAVGLIETGAAVELAGKVVPKFTKAEQAALDKAEADRLAAEKEASEKAEADRLAAEAAANSNPEGQGSLT